MEINGHRIELSHLDKVLFPDDGITKEQLIRYYSRIAPVILPHLAGRPLSFQRFPDGINQEGFYQKNTPDYYPEWIRRIPTESGDETVNYAAADTTVALIYFSQQAVITYHPWLSRFDKPLYPDAMVFDLDPGQADFNAVRQAAFDLRQLLLELDIRSFVKTTGSRGLHVTVPLDRTLNFQRVKAFAQNVAEVLTGRSPKDLTTEIRIAKRVGRIFVDTARNNYGQTAVAPYSIRARPGAPVAVPVTWEELGEAELNSSYYNITNVFELLNRRIDPWKDLYTQAQDLTKALHLIENLKANRNSR
ncbi:MAG: non-homologous end-joining DNA ligase [Dehalogenimonas sp.]|uniref:Non-homologous end-joining DNA ligase n=1 Tax=Candidatus Dehalogenimonas loeffleri TaxID=3127115 RepID=A0ABZ2J7L3_9CHLR|nr:non-homologous end-joining DNA ligase [Dehalogenimonas sp.]